MKKETIAAIATPVAEGGIGVIRISGKNAIKVLEAVFHPVRKHIENKKIISDMARMSVIEDQIMSAKMAEMAGVSPYALSRDEIEEELDMYMDTTVRGGMKAYEGTDGRRTRERKRPKRRPLKRGKAGFLPTAVSETTGLPIENRRMSYGFIKDPETGQVIDEVMAVAMKEPYTYTRENVAEIYCHGSVVALRKTLDLVLKNGARMAEPGEFTKRAFLNGRLDLSQAEAIIDLIKAKTDTGFNAAMSQIQGGLSKKIKEIRNELMNILVDVAVNIDYPEEQIDHLTYRIMTENLRSTNKKIKQLLDSTSTGKIIKDGLKIAIIGKPNVGKSSLMNILLKEDRAIVTSIPGTTRDTIEETASIRGIKVVLTDTAGIRETEDEIEKLGIERSKITANNADVVLFVVDGSKQLSKEDLEIAEAIKGNRVIIVLNKRDKEAKVQIEDIRKILPGKFIAETSMKKEEGIEAIEDKLERFVYGGENGISKDDIMITNARHEDILRQSYELINSAVEMIEKKEPLDIIEIDIKEAFEILGEIIGETVTDEIMNEVFSRFCLGK